MSLVKDHADCDPKFRALIRSSPVPFVAKQESHSLGIDGVKQDYLSKSKFFKTKLKSCFYSEENFDVLSAKKLGAPVISKLVHVRSCL